MRVSSSTARLLRCHTFGIGSEVCVELVTGIAAASGGKCTLLADGERLQTKVMEVLKQSLQPSLMDTVLKWNPPEGYTVVDSTPRNLGTLYSSNSYTAFAYLRKTESKSDGSDIIDERSPPTTPISGATIAGRVGGEEVEILVNQAVLPGLTEAQNSELSSILNQNAAWSKLCDLEAKAFSSSRKNSHNENEKLEAPAKRPRLNGMTSSSSAVGTEESKQQQDQLIREELLELSLESGIPCALTCFVSDSDSTEEEHRITQILPSLPNSTPNKQVPNGKVLQYQLQRMYSRKRKRHQYHHQPVTTPNHSLTSLAKSSIGAVSNALKQVVNIATFGLLGQEGSPPVENGRRIDDELEFQANKDSRLRWDDGRGQLVYPSFYFRSHPSNHRPQSPSSDQHNKRKSTKSSKHATSAQSSNPTNHKMEVTCPVVNCEMRIPPVNGINHSMRPHSVAHPPNGSIVQSSLHSIVLDEISDHSDHSGGEEDEFTISDSESDSSVDPDWDDLKRPNELLPLIHMQLFSGAWPIVRAFSYAVGVPLEEIRKLPLRSKLQNGKCAPTPAQSIPPPSPSYSQSEIEDESKAHFWTTALAIACLEEYFTQFQCEWQLVAHKGQCWLEQNVHLTELSMAEVQRLARELVLRQS